MSINKTIKQIETEKILPVIRTDSTEKAAETIKAVISGGIKILEITMSVPGALDLIGKFSEDRELLVGAGTVLDAETAHLCIESGAEFIVSPVFDKEIIKICNEQGAVSIIGAATPTEVYTAYASGADFIKVFPVSSFGGSKYIKALCSVFPEIKYIPTGGITIENSIDFLKAGAKAFGIGGSLTDGTAETIKYNCEAIQKLLAN